MTLKQIWCDAVEYAMRRRRQFRCDAVTIFYIRLQVTTLLGTSVARPAPPTAHLVRVLVYFNFTMSFRSSS